MTRPEGKPDPGPVLRRLSEDLDVEGTLSDFPGMSREDLSKMLAEAGNLDPAGSETAFLYVDGGARGNPGPAGAGVVIEWGGQVVSLGEYIGEATNNVAEYRALLLGLETAAGMGIDKIEIRSDSELMVKQVNGQYKIKSPALMDLYFSAIKLLSGFSRTTVSHIPREQNVEADRMANMAIDAKGPVKL